MNSQENHTNLSTNGQQNEAEPEFNLSEFLYKYLRYWPWFLLSLIVALFAVYTYLRYSIPVYSVSSQILIKDDKAGGPSGGQLDVLNELNLFNTKNNVNNEVAVLKTKYLMNQVVRELQLNVKYFVKGNIKSTDLYNRSPFELQVVTIKDSIPTKEFAITLKPNGYHLSGDSLNGDFKYHDTIATKDLSFAVVPKTLLSEGNKDYTVTVSSIRAATSNYTGGLTANIIDKQASVIQLQLNETVPQRGEDVLNTVYSVYTRLNQEDKNRITDSTINFIDERLALVSNELSGVESNLQQFKQQNELINLEQQGQLALTTSADLQKQIIDAEVKIAIVEQMEDFLQKNSRRLVPASLVVDDPTYLNMVQQYNGLLMERDRQVQTSKEDNPVVQQLDDQIETMKRSLLSSLQSIKRGLITGKNALQQKSSQASGQIRRAPEKERAFLDISRQQEVKQQLYLYLLQKREESAISKSGSLANSRLIEPAVTNPVPVSPKKSLLYLAGLLAGLIIPAAFLYLKELLNNKVQERKDVTSVVNAPILGEIGHNATQELVVVQKESRTPLAEQFRIVRTNLQFILGGGDHKSILITSSMSGEGKSFFSINLASSLAIAGKKVVLVEMDLRKPKISSELGVSNSKGFSSYMIGQTKLDELPVQHEGFYVVSSGPIPPNPAELLLQPKVADLFSYLKEQFDYVIVDTPPIGLVTDAILIGKFVNAGIYMVRQNYTFKNQLNIAKELFNDNRIPNISILINDVKVGGRYGYGYGYRYGYGYGRGTNGYYFGNEKKTTAKWRKGN